MNRFTRIPTAAAGLLLATALPALAQTGLCGGIGDAGQWLGGDEAGSDIATSATYLEQMALVLMNNEYVGLFTVSATTDVRVEAEARGMGDTVIDLRDAAGNIVVSDDDSGGNAASLAQANLQPGTYCLSMRSYDGSPLTGFVRVGRTEHEQLTDGFTAGTMPPPEDDWGYNWPAYCDASLVTNYLSDGPVDSLLQSGGVTVSAGAAAVPFWGFTLNAPTAISITASNPSADPVITLYDEFGSWLAENDDWDGLNSRIDVTYPLQPGSYCISVAALSDTALPIDITLTAYDAQAAMTGMYERGEASPPLDGSYPVTMLGELGGRVRQDVMVGGTANWFAFDVKEGGLVVIEAVTNGMGDTVIALFDDFGRQVAFNDDANNSLDSMIATRVMPGTYSLAVWQYAGEGQQVMTRMLFERYVPAN